MEAFTGNFSCHDITQNTFVRNIQRHSKPECVTKHFSRLGLERADTAEKSVDVITDLLERYGQGGPCMEDESGFTYHNSFLISDKKEAWLLETSGKYWAAERVEGNQNKNIINGHISA